MDKSCALSDIMDGLGVGGSVPSIPLPKNSKTLMALGPHVMDVEGPMRHTRGWHKGIVQCNEGIAHRFLL